ncbi:MAG: trimeric intracellular cation channel family protein [Pirellulales bacterium]
MQYFLEHVATAVCAISGALAARGKQVDLFGVVVLALVTALGGGTLRDLVLDASPVFWIADNSYAATAVISAVVVFAIARFVRLSGKPLLLADAGGLALFTILGVEKSLRHGTTSMIAVAMGVITGVAGGMIRDVLTREIPLVLRREIYLYATASFCGALLFVLLEPLVPPSPLRFLAIGTTLALRLAAIAWRINLPEFQAKEH